jgi:acetylornithine deacetylase/succinyl-diaminopimelate desuccinylase-like protein
MITLETMTMTNHSPIYERPVEILQNLIRFDTTNPPGNEADCIAYINGLLNDAGIPTTILARDPDRPNLVARLTGRGDAPPLLLYGHVDVVTTEGQEWTHPPFSGDSADGCVWGRGALDMKGGVAMMLAAVTRAHAEKADLPGDVVLAIVSDEETLGDYGASYLVEEHPALFEGVRYALGEFGGFSLVMLGRTFYPIMVAEKQVCWMRAALRGPAGHGSIVSRGGAMAKLGDLLQKLDRHRLPVHITPAARMMFEAVGRALPFPAGMLIRQLLNPALTDRILGMMGDQGRLFEGLLHNTVNATVVRGGNKVNVIPGEITLELDGRLLPGFTPDDLIRELRQIVGGDAVFEVVDSQPHPGDLDMGLFDTLAGVLKEADPGGVPMPMLMSGATDGRCFAQLGIQTYGFLPMILPPDFNFISTIHAADERIPVEAVAFGANAIFEVLRRFGG